jgi:hypothetical protein
MYNISKKPTKVVRFNRAKLVTFCCLEEPLVDTLLHKGGMTATAENGFLDTLTFYLSRATYL